MMVFKLTDLRAIIFFHVTFKNGDAHSCKVPRSPSDWQLITVTVVLLNITRACVLASCVWEYVFWMWLIKGWMKEFEGIFHCNQGEEARCVWHDSHYTQPQSRTSHRDCVPAFSIIRLHTDTPGFQLFMVFIVSQQGQPHITSCHFTLVTVLPQATVLSGQWNKLSFTVRAPFTLVSFDSGVNKHGTDFLDWQCNY